MHVARGGAWAISALWLFLAYYPSVCSLEMCSHDKGDGVCPAGNTCCRRYDGGSGCIPSDMGSYNATCCPDGGVTGCPLGYACRSKSECIAHEGDHFDPLVKLLPRYNLCNASGIEHVYGFDLEDGAELGYHSSHGSINNMSFEKVSTVQMVLIMIHGANRNADDYFCVAKQCVEMQGIFENVVVLAPYFFSETDELPCDRMVYWKGDKDGSWRYGADSHGPTKISSFTALDEMIDYVLSIFPNVVRLVVAGHSSGGQAVQRWSLLTSHWKDGIVHAVVANPSSFAYLSALRKIHRIWTIPRSCPEYNQWQWGLAHGGTIEVPYRDQALQNISDILHRFRERKVFYLTGSQDSCNISGTNGWCHSHGLERTCMDNVQGRNRLERSFRYMEHLKNLDFGDNHLQYIVSNVGHDHAMIFQSFVGLQTIFGSKKTSSLLPTNRGSLSTGG